MYLALSLALAHKVSFRFRFMRVCKVFKVICVFKCIFRVINCRGTTRKMNLVMSVANRTNALSSAYWTQSNWWSDWLVRKGFLFYVTETDNCKTRPCSSGICGKWQLAKHRTQLIKNSVKDHFSRTLPKVENNFLAAGLDSVSLKRTDYHARETLLHKQNKVE